MAAAELYESKFVPAFFAEWAPHLVDLAGVGPGQAVLDVACGTGIVARTAADRLAGAGRVVGVDLNQAMLTVARRVRPDLEWRQGDAGALPFPDESFDGVLCQMALMFFPDRAGALREMRRVAGAGATVALVVPGATWTRSRRTRRSSRWSRITPAPTPPSLLGAYFACGDLGELTALVESAGLPSRRPGPASAARGSPRSTSSSPPRSRARPLIGRIDAESYARGSARAPARCCGRS